MQGFYRDRWKNTVDLSALRVETIKRPVVSIVVVEAQTDYSSPSNNQRHFPVSQKIPSNSSVNHGKYVQP